MNERALNRALLARQGLLEPFDGPVVDVVERIGAMQAQHWPAVPVGLWTRMRSFAPGDLWAALAAGELRFGISLRGTLHLVSAREHPAYAAVAEAAGVDDWRRTKAPLPAAGAGLRTDLLAWAGERPREVAEAAPFAEGWIAEHPGAVAPEEVEAQRAVKWRPLLRCSRLVRVPAGGTWGPRTPALSTAAPAPRDAPVPEAAIDEGVRRHLRAFGPAAVDDIAGWLGLAPAVLRPRLEAMADSLEAIGVGRRTLHDLPGAPRPGEDAPAPVRFLGDFDSMLLAYTPKHRARIWPDALRDLVYVRGNLRIRSTVLVDGMVAGVWGDEAKRGAATLTITLGPGVKLARGARREVVAEGERLLAARHPRAKARRVAFSA